MVLEVGALGFREDLGCRAQGLGFREDLGCRV